MNILIPGLAANPRHKTMPDAGAEFEEDRGRAEVGGAPLDIALQCPAIPGQGRVDGRLAEEPVHQLS